MRLVGDLVLAGFGQIKNARIDNVSSDPASPQNGQIWYNTTDGKYRGFDGNSVITFATGGSTALLQTEIDNIESAAGLSAEGAYVAPTTSNYLNSTTTLAGADAALDGAIKTVSDAVAAETTRAQGAESTLTDAVAAETTRATAAEGTLTTNLAAEVTRAQGAESTLTAAVAAETTRAQGAESTLTAAVAAETTRAQGAESTLTSNLSAEVTRATAAEAALSGDLAAETTRAQAAEGTLTVALADEVTRAQTAEADLAADMAAKLAGLTWKNSVRAIAMSNITLSGEKTVDGVSLIAGDRVLVNGQSTQAENGIYIVSVGSWSRAADMDATTPLNEFNSAAVFVEAGNTYADTGWTEVKSVSVVGTDDVSFTQFNGAAGITAGVGLDKSGNTLLVKADGTSITVGAAGISLSAALQLEISTATADIAAEATRAAAAEGAIEEAYQAADATEQSRALAAESALDTAYKAADAAELTRAQAAEGVLTAAVAAEVTRATAAEGTLTTNLAAEVTRAQGAEGTLTTNLAAEVTRATAAEGVLTSDLAAEVTRATGAEGTIDARITASQYVYDGSTAATSHTVNHNLGQKYGQVIVVDSNDKVIIPDAITFTNNNSLTVDFISAITCKVIYSAPKL